MNLRPHALQTKQPVVIMDGAPRRKLVRQHTPRTAGTVQIENAIDNFLHAHLSRATAGLGWGNQGFYELPLLIRQIAWIWRPFHIILYRQKMALQPLFTHALRYYWYPISILLIQYQQITAGYLMLVSHIAYCVSRIVY